MSHPHFPLLASCFFLLASSLSAATPSAAATPYVFTGRVMDASHAGFDGSRVCALSAKNANGEQLASTKTVFRADLRDNYALSIPVATSPAGKFAVQSDVLEIEATDDNGKVWHGVITNAACGEAGGVRHVDIVLCEDKDGDGIDDALLDALRDQWEDSDFWRPGEAFDPNADYDGDGVSAIDEAYAGTNPFSADDVLRITDFTHAYDGGSLSFGASAGRAYTLETATNLVGAVWASEPFALSEGGAATRAVSVSPSRAGGVIPTTIYLLPAESSSRFFRVRVE